MHPTRKGKQWDFGMKAHIGVDAVSRMAHSLVGTAANLGDPTQAGKRFHRAENRKGFLFSVSLNPEDRNTPDTDDNIICTQYNFSGDLKSSRKMLCCDSP